VESKRATKETGARISSITTAMEANTHEIPSPEPLTARGDEYMPGGQCHPCASCVKCHLHCHAIMETRLAPTRWRAVCDRKISWQGNCMESVGRG
jgi:hypothetical protein